MAAGQSTREGTDVSDKQQFVSSISAAAAATAAHALIKFKFPSAK